jgi:hypothetical protein
MFLSLGRAQSVGFENWGKKKIAEGDGIIGRS